MDAVAKSKLLSLVLRHAPEKAGLTLQQGGWVEVTALLDGLEKMGATMTLAELVAVVETNEKKRFTLSHDGALIRAAQGHSVEIDPALSPIAPPAQLFHGTATRFMEAIRVEGLKPMTRLHVHLSLDADTATKVGSRHGKPVVLIVRAGDMAHAGHEFYQADNGVWLTATVPPTYLDFQGSIP
jgi:putative RNA 2'-phosphotransferase